MKRKKIIGLVLAIIVLVVGFGGYKIYADHQAENVRVEKLNSIKKIEINKDDLKYISDKKLVKNDYIKSYEKSKNNIKSNEDANIEKLVELEKDLNKNIAAIDSELTKKVDSKKNNSLKKVNKLKAKTKAEKSNKKDIKNVLSKKYKTSKNDVKNISLSIKKYKSIAKQDSKIKVLNKKIDKRVAKENAANQSYTGVTNYTGGTNTPNYNNSESNNSGSNNSGNNNSGNSNSGGNGRPDWYNKGGSYCETLENGINTDCINW